ncbi:hypothetical protein E2C01_002344 [Portunus trituberculatus]|uniref:Uncharacterized protein n=1 Tax=Portunus trituberculatus TaxID=210409 RepID=A0A5B7CM15_PORTR|nr:hypothetical protein [Portunus trituberculatus]
MHLSLAEPAAPHRHPICGRRPNALPAHCYPQQPLHRSLNLSHNTLLTDNHANTPRTPLVKQRFDIPRRGQEQQKQ